MLKTGDSGIGGQAFLIGVVEESMGVRLSLLALFDTCVKGLRLNSSFGVSGENNW